MPPSTNNQEKVADDAEHSDWTFHDVWISVSSWFIRFFRGINNETIEHPYLIAFALLVVCAWPHILMLPIWFGKDAYRRMEYHARSVGNTVTTTINPPRRRKRDIFVTAYRSMSNATARPEAPLFGGMPITDGDFTIEEERKLPIALRVIRWTALAWAAFMVGRELYFLISRHI